MIIWISNVAPLSLERMHSKNLDSPWLAGSVFKHAKQSGSTEKTMTDETDCYEKTIFKALNPNLAYRCVTFSLEACFPHLENEIIIIRGHFRS